jgi:hypothetical protein
MNEFQFFSKLDQTILLGRKARNAQELLEGIQEVPGSSIYHHTHRYLQQHHYLSPEPPNDFAYWVSEVLNDAVLGEKLSSIDIIQFTSIADLRKSLIEAIEQHIHSAVTLTDCPPGEEFHFMACQTVVFKTPHTAHELAAFKQILQQISINSLYYHMFDARLRIGKNDNDFSRWFSDLGYTKLAEEISRLDPYTQTLEGLRKRIISLVNRYDRH